MALFGVIGVIWLLVAIGMPLLSTDSDGPELVGLPLTIAGIAMVGFVVCAVAGLIAVIAS